MALAGKIRDQQIVLIDKLAFDEPKTREMAAIVKALKCDSPSLLVATEAYDATVYKSARNIAGVTVAPMADLNALSVSRSRLLLMTPAVLDALRANGNGDKPKATGDKPKRAKKPTKKTGS
jgi:large subunit ribosomal protein L4